MTEDNIINLANEQEIDYDIQCEEFYNEEYSLQELFTFSDGNFDPIYKNYNTELE